MLTQQAETKWQPFFNKAVLSYAGTTKATYKR